MTTIRNPGTICEVPPEYRILDDLDDWYLSIDEDHKIQWANLALRRIIKTPPGDIRQVIHALGGNGALITEIFTAIKEKDEISPLECRFRDPDGKESFYLCSGRKTPPDESWLLRFQSVPGVEDCETIVEYTGTATILIEDDGTISVANSEFERLSGYPREEIVGIKKLTDFIASEDERRQVMGYHALRQRDSSTAPGNYSFSFINRSGNIHIVEVTIGMIPRINRSVMSLSDVTARKRIEQALQKSEERLNLALTATKDGLVDWDVSTGVVFYSLRCFTMLGYEPGAFVPSVSTLLSLVHPDDRRHLERSLASMVTGGHDHRGIEFRLRSASGKWVHVLDRLQVVRRDADGRPLRIAGTHSDITERKEAERELLIRDMAMESSLSPIAIADLDGYLIYVNQAVLDMRGLVGPQEILGRHISELWVDPEEIQKALKALARHGRYTGEQVGLRGDGREFTAYTTVNFVIGNTGEPICMVATAIDTTEKRRMEEALRESEERYRTLAESAPDGIFLISVEGDVSYLSSAGGRLFGVEPETIAGRNIRDFFPPDIVKRWLETTRRAADSTAGPTTGETFLPGEAGGTWLETRLIPVVERDGSTRIVLGISRDITERKQTEEQLWFQALVLRQVDNAVIAVDMDGRITYMNRAAEQLYGISSEEALGRPSTEIVTYDWPHQDDREEAWRALRDSGIWRGTTVHRKLNGDIIFVDAALSALEDDNEDVVGMLCSFRDITEQRRVNLELRIKDMAIASSLGAVALVDLSGRIIYVNRASLIVHGWRREDVIGRPFSIVWTDREEGERIRDEALQSGAWLGEIEARRCDGTTFPMQLALSVVTDESGRALCLMGSGIDISQQKEAERDLRIRDMAMASSLSAFAIADLDGHLTYANQAFLSMWGYDSEAEVLGRSVTEFWQGEEEAVNTLQTLIATGRYISERIGKRRDGTIFHGIFSGSLVTDDTGVPICLTASIADITDLRRAKAEIQARNRELSVLNQIVGVSTSATNIDKALEGVLAATITLLDFSSGGIYLIAPDKRSARLACSQDLPEDFPGRTYIPDITVPPYVDVLVDGHANFACEPEESDLPPYAAIPIVAPGGVIGSLILVPHDREHPNDADQPLLVAIGRGVGGSIERTLLIRQLEEAQREANLYLDILSHDIRNTENISGLYTDLLISKLEGEEREYAQRIQSSIRKGVEILRNVSTIRRIHHESAMLMPVDLDWVIQSEIDSLSGISFSYEGTDLSVMADQLLPEVFTNLIGNAVKFGGTETEIAITVEESGDDILVSVEDTGPGIPDEMKETVFMRFGKNSNQKSGQGLGLYITRMLIKRYGSRIWVDDRVPGRPECGAAFRFTLKKA